MPTVRRALDNLAAGKYGKVLRMRARPKDDRRGGGEELAIHGTHWFDQMMAFAGRPRWVSGHITVAGRDITVKDVGKGSEPVGPIAGDSISAMFGFADGVRGYFDSTANLFRPGVAFRDLHCLQIECERVLLQIRQPGDVYVYPAPMVQPDHEKLTWERIWVEDWHYTADHKPRPMNDWIHRGNQAITRDLLQAIAANRDPISNGYENLYVLEMIQGVYTSHFAEGRRLSIPLTQRRHPLQ
jgi:predicted dehydrogenase